MKTVCKKKWFRVNPVYKKELKQNARMPRTVLVLVVYNCLMLLFGLFAFYITFEGNRGYSAGVNYADILGVYTIMTGVEFALLLLIMPMLTASSIAGEREKQTLDILLTTRLTPAKLLSGKLQSAMSMILLLIASSLPILALVFSVGGVTFREIIQYMLLCVAVSMYIGSIGVFFSVLCRKTTSATIWSYAVLFFILFGTVIIVCGATLFQTIKNGTEYYSVFSTYTYYMTGIGSVAFLLLVNPLLSFAALVKEQAGSAELIMGALQQEGAVGIFISQHWLSVSICVQLLAAAILLHCSVRMLQPKGSNPKR